jgi:vacuole morphology and inheritance protein 14
VFYLLPGWQTAELRAALKSSSENRQGAALFTTLYPSWCHSAVAAVSLCLLSQVYGPASRVVSSFGDLDITVDLLVQVDQLVQLLETPVFTYLRLQLLEPGQHPALLKTLYGLLLLLPQSSAWATLSARLQCVPTLQLLQPQSSASGGAASLAAGADFALQDSRFSANGADLVATFRAMQARRPHA